MSSQYVPSIQLPNEIEREWNVLRSNSLQETSQGEKVGDYKIVQQS
jgi:hypothetical protein